MGHWLRLLGAVALAASLASAPAAEAQTTAAPKQTTLKKRAKRPEPAGRQITVRPRPSYLTGGTNVPVGSYNGYVVDTFAQPSPIEGTFVGQRGRERLDNRFDGGDTGGFTLFRF